MDFKYIEIENFKGIKQAKIDFSNRPRSNIYTLVGLNESGKTTILEAINFFRYGQEKLDPLELYGYAIKDIHDLMPVGERDNFNGNMIIRVHLVLDDQDEAAIKTYCRKIWGFRLMEEVGDIVIEQSFPFKNSIYSGTPEFHWTIELVGKAKGAKKPKDMFQSSRTAWNDVTEFIKSRVPSVLYFPNFLFNFPERIYLENYGYDDDLYSFYRKVLQDILNALGSGTNLRTHILNRAKSVDDNDKRALSALLLKMGRHVSKVVFEAWSRIFRQDMRGKDLAIECKSEKDGETTRYYIEFRIRESDQEYSIRERSLGFRWFFVFLMLTQYRAYRDDSTSKVWFLFDEPASNLHQTAQRQLLLSLGDLAESSVVIYTTHSHHLINPEWLEGAYVIKNEGLDYDRDIETYSSHKTTITIDRYRDFAVKHPNQYSYYQPILDVLDYMPSRLEMVPNVVMTEGKTDFYALSYFSQVCLSSVPSLNFLPGTGSGALDVPIQLYLAWCRQFVVLFDSDKEGRTQKDRYVEKFGELLEGRLFLLSDIDASWKNKTLEKLIPGLERLAFQKTVYPDAKKYNKTHFCRAVQENLLAKRQYKWSESTLKTLDTLLKFLAGKLSAT